MNMKIATKKKKILSLVLLLACVPAIYGETMSVATAREWLQHAAQTVGGWLARYLPEEQDFYTPPAEEKRGPKVLPTVQPRQLTILPYFAPRGKK
jgi:hypothetical protein